MIRNLVEIIKERIPLLKGADFVHGFRVFTKSGVCYKL